MYIYICIYIYVYIYMYIYICIYIYIYAIVPYVYILTYKCMNVDFQAKSAKSVVFKSEIQHSIVNNASTGLNSYVINTIYIYIYIYIYI